MALKGGEEEGREMAVEREKGVLGFGDGDRRAVGCAFYIGKKLVRWKGEVAWWRVTARRKGERRLCVCPYEGDDDNEGVSNIPTL